MELRVEKRERAHEEESEEHEQEEENEPKFLMTFEERLGLKL